ncbi:hypothetical protein [Streptomyces arboris]|uniref:hypothetical protein n=1 Tax=Streptomyces arboris TaxID=2600619 RepID=UPI00363905FD
MTEALSATRGSAVEAPIKPAKHGVELGGGAAQRAQPDTRLLRYVQGPLQRQQRRPG